MVNICLMISCQPTESRSIKCHIPQKGKEGVLVNNVRQQAEI